MAGPDIGYNADGSGWFVLRSSVGSEVWYPWSGMVVVGASQSGFDPRIDVGLMSVSQVSGSFPGSIVSCYGHAWGYDPTAGVYTEATVVTNGPDDPKICHSSISGRWSPKDDLSFSPALLLGCADYIGPGNSGAGEIARWGLAWNYDAVVGVHSVRIATPASLHQVAAYFLSHNYFDMVTTQGGPPNAVWS
jgi:hypothetical protein